LPALILVILVQAFSPGVLLKSEAKDLTDVLAQGFSFGTSIPLPFFTPTGDIAVAPAAGAAVAPAFSAAIAQAVTQEVPLASVAPAFTYRFNPALDIFERLTGVPGPLFSERAPTLGKGQFNFAVGYAFLDFSELNGTDLDNIRSPGLFTEFFPEESFPVGQLPTGEELFFVPVSDSLLRTRIDLQAHVIVPTLRYGITDKWDVSLSIPIVNTFLRVRNESVRVVDPAFPAGGAFTLDAQENLKDFQGFIDPEGKRLRGGQIPLVRSQRPAKSLKRAAGSATGVGDIMLRGKYHLWQSELGGAALGLNLQLPSGEVRDFHGTDETHLSTFLYLSEVLWERFEPHLNVGVDFNADNVDRSSFLYAVGGSLLVGTRLGLIVDFIGRSEFGRFPVRIPPEGLTQGFALDKESDTCTAEQPCFPDLDRGLFSFPIFAARIKRNDIADFTFGLRYALGTSGSVFFGGVVPLNSDGFRPDFIPSGGIEYTF
jgi:hypothetical protein